MQNLLAMWNDGDGVSTKSYSQSKHGSRVPNGTQLPSLRDMKPNYSDVVWNKRVDNVNCDLTSTLPALNRGRYIATMVGQQARLHLGA